MNNLPVARNRNIVVQRLDKETLIYDLDIHKAFCLNETSALVYQHCDGKTSFEELKTKDGSLSDEVIFLALDQLGRENLLDEAESPIPTGIFNNLPRREVIRKLGASSLIALPVISMLIAPTAAQAQSSGTCVPTSVVDRPPGEGFGFYADILACQAAAAAQCCSGSAHFENCDVVPGTCLCVCD